jgi:hypothetical protein
MLSVIRVRGVRARAHSRAATRGITIAKQLCAYRGRKQKLSDSEIVDVRRRIERGETKAFVAREFGFSFSRETCTSICAPKTNACRAVRFSPSLSAKASCRGRQARMI